MTWTDFMQRLFERRQPTGAQVPPVGLVRLNAELSVLRSVVDAGDIGAAMCSWDGYVREAALVRCVELGEASLLPAVVQRLNDWVPQIRHVARSAMLELLPAADMEVAVSVLPEVQRLAEASREDHRAWIARFELALLDKVGAEKLLEAVRTASLQIARACFLLLSRHTVIDSRTLTEIALDSLRDVILAVRALDAFAPRAGEVSPDAIGIYRLALRSKFGRVRAQALRWLLSVTPAQAIDSIAVDALLDGHSGARDAAAFFLRREGFDVGGYYCRAVADAQLPLKRRVIALQSLASLRNAGDVQCVRDFTGSAHASLRKAALLGLLKMVPDELDAIALAMLGDEEPFIRRQALRLAVRQRAYIADEPACALLLARRDTDLLLAFIRGAKWRWLAWLARLADDTRDDAPLFRALADSLAEWADEAASRFDYPSLRDVQYLTMPASRLALERLAGDRLEIRHSLAFEFQTLASMAARRAR